MSYYIDIIDTTSPETRIVYEIASGGGIVLSWNGADKKDDLKIVSSELNFDMLDRTAQDAAFINFYTGNETRFKVQVINDVDDSILWQGYILPDLYSEPYKNVNLFVNFTATDGLGRLKGKYLPADYYDREKSVIDILCTCLRLINLQLDLYFSPAIENFAVKNWNEIYIDTANFNDKSKQKDAYSILETLLTDMLCVCYQADNRWYIEGMNVRQLRQVIYKTYDYIGNPTGTVTYDRMLKQITALVTPSITIVPPYNEITVTHKKTEPKLPATISQEANDGWAIVSASVVGIVDPTDWMANASYYAKCLAPDYYTRVYNEYYFDGVSGTVWTQDDTKFISLRQKLYMEANAKANFNLAFLVIHPNDGYMGTPTTWAENFKYEIVFNGTVIYSNIHSGTIQEYEKLFFDEGGNAKIKIDHIFAEEGLLDIRLFRPWGRFVDTGLMGIELQQCAVNIIGFVDEIVETSLINDDFTIDCEVDLTFSDDKSGFSNGFRLKKLKENGAYNEIQVPVYYGFTFDSKFYTVVQLEGANLIKENKYQVFFEGNNIPVYDVIYNFQNGEQMVIESDRSFELGDYLYVRKYAVQDVVSSRLAWGQWTDAFYKIENNPYAKTVANIYRRMFSTAHEKLDLTALNAIKFNDIILFHYVFMKDFQVLNCSWNLDTNKTTMTLARSYYADSTGVNPDEENIPPIVVANDDIYLADGVTTATLSAEAYDPDGTIEAKIWTKTAGTDGTIVTPLELITNLSGLNEDNYTFQIEVTDNDGATATDTVNIIRVKNYVVTLDLVETVTHPDNPLVWKQKFKVNVTPTLPPNYALSLSGKFTLESNGGQNPGIASINTSSISWYSVEKNGVTIESKTNQVDKSGYNYLEFPLALSYLSAVDTFIVLGGQFSGKHRRKRAWAWAFCNITTVTLTAGIGTVTGTPIYKETLIKS